MEWFHCMKCLVQPEDFKSGAAPRGFVLTSCGHVLCAHCTDKNACSKCACSPVQTVPVSGDMPADIMVLFEDPADTIKSIYKGNLFQSGHTKHLVEGVSKRNERLSRKEAELTSTVRHLTKELAEVREQMEAMKLENKRLGEKVNHDERARSSRALFEQRRRPEASSFPDNVPVHPLLSAMVGSGRVLTTNKF